MSDSDDTDVLLLIPPDLFLVHSDDDSDSLSYKHDKSGVVSELIEQVQSLESRVTAIESKDSPNNSLINSRRLSLDSTMNYRQTLPRTKFSASPNSNLQKTPTKYPQCYSSPTTPSIRQHLHHTNEMHHNLQSCGNDQSNSLNSNKWNKHDDTKLFSEFSTSQTPLQNKNLSHVGYGSSEKAPHSILFSALNGCENNVHAKSQSSLSLSNSPSKFNHTNVHLKSVKDMNLDEVDYLLKKLEFKDKKSTTRNTNYDGLYSQLSFNKSPKKSYSMERSDQDKKKMDQHKLKFNFNEQSSQFDSEKRKDMSDFTLQNDSSFSSFDTEKFMTDFKTCEIHESKMSLIEPIIFEENEKVGDMQQKEIVQPVNESDIHSYVPISNNTGFSLDNKRESIHQQLDTSLMSKYADEITKSQTISTTPGINQNMHMTSCKSCPSIFKTPSNLSISNATDTLTKKADFSNNINSSIKSVEQSNVNSVNNAEQRHQRPQRLLTLSDFWNQDSSKSQDEQLKIKLEEERLRREHCEQLIQDLQKKLLEQQEKIAVAVRVDDEKNMLISHFQESWKKLKQKLFELESERENLQKLLKSITEKHRIEIADFQEQMKKNKEELSKALNLATGYKEKSDSLVQEKIDLLKSHSEELQSYKSLVQEAESRYEEMKKEYQKLLEKSQQTDETLKIVQQDLNKELIKSNDVRSEMAVIHKALDTCEAELTILRQEKENLQLKLKEELNRNSILEESKASLAATIDEIKKAEKLAKSEVKALTEQQEKLRAELREVYQKQVDEVVKTKLEEFQKQLDSAESIFQNELETKQRAIAEVAARKMKSVIDKYQLEINLVEEKHREEKKLFEVKLAQETQKSAMLEAQLNTYRKSKNHLVEQLHSMMQKQWQQALLIISGGNIENMPSFQKFNVDKLFESTSETNLDIVPKLDSTSSKQVKLKSQKSPMSFQNGQRQEQQDESFITLTSNDETPLTSRKESKNDFQKYIKMILDMQQSQEDHAKPKFFNTSPPSSHRDNSNKQSVQKDDNTSNEGNSTWQPISEISIHDTSEYLSVPQKFSLKSEQHKQKPPWK